MLLDIEEKKILYTFGCSGLNNTVIRLKHITSLTVDPEAKHRLTGLLRKLEEDGDADDYFNHYILIRREMDTYYKAKRKIDRIEGHQTSEVDYDKTV